MRRLSIIGAALVAVVLLADILVWHWATGQVALDTELWAEARRAEGWTVSMGAPEREGWPLAARIHVHDLKIVAPFAGLPGGASLAADDASIGVNLLAWRRLEIFLDHAQRVRLGTAPEIAFTTRRHAIAMDLPETSLPSIADIRIDGLDAIMGPDGARLLVDRGTVHVVSAPDTLRATVDAETIDLPPSPLATGLGQRIQRIALDLAVVGGLQVTPAAWRDAGGNLAVRQFDLTWGSLVASGNANFRLDKALQPEGTAEARLVGTQETLDALASARLIAPRAAMAAKAVLQLLQRPQPDGPPMVQLPLTLQDRTLQMGRIPLVKIPELIW
jgi:hypothetical protein